MVLFTAEKMRGHYTGLLARGKLRLPVELYREISSASMRLEEQQARTTHVFDVVTNARVGIDDFGMMIDECKCVGGLGVK
jgi:hypothetical protein